MQTDKPKKRKLDGSNLKIAIIFSQFNHKYGDKLLFSTVETLKANGVSNIFIEKVPGALELPFVAKKLAQKKKYDVIIALGVVIKGDTYHFEIVSDESHRGLMSVSLNYNLPIIYGVICAYNIKQVAERCSLKKMNKGKDFAIAAIEMALINKKL